MSTAQHWYSIPDKTIAKALKAGHPRCPTEIAIRPQTGDDVQRSLEADVRKGIAFMTKKVEATICGVNYDPKRDKAKRLVVSRAAESPELFPDYIFASLPAPVVTMLLAVFSELNDPETDEFEAFKTSHSAVV
jgi:hypothetical protein